MPNGSSETRQAFPGRRRLSALVVSPTPTHPTDAGNRKRIRRVCEAIQRRGGEVHFLYFPREWGGKVDLDAFRAMQEAWDFFHVLAPSFPPPHVTRKSHWNIDDWWDGAIGNYIGWLNGNVSFDIAIVNYAFFSQALEALPPRTLKVLDTHDRLSDRAKLLSANNLDPEFFYTTADEEAKALRRADLVLAIKDEERLFFESITTTPVMTLGHIEDARFVPAPAPAPRLRCGFLGSGNGVNRENLRRFIKVALPSFRAAGVELVVAGTVCQWFDAEPGMTLLGRVDDVASFYQGIDIFIAPFDFSTGLKIKVIEALSFGVPVAGTANAFEGVPGAQPYQRLASLGALAELCVELSRNRERLADMRAQCRDQFQALAGDVLAAVDRILALSRDRILIVPTRDFFEEETDAQRRTALLMRAFAEIGHCVLLYPFPADQRVRKGVEDWQWGFDLQFPLQDRQAAEGGPALLPPEAVLQVAEAHGASVVVLLSPEYRGVDAGPDRLAVVDLAGVPGAGGPSAAPPSAAPVHDGPLALVAEDPAGLAALADRAGAGWHEVPALDLDRGQAPSGSELWILSDGRADGIVGHVASGLAGDWRSHGHATVELFLCGAASGPADPPPFVRPRAVPEPAAACGAPAIVIDLAPGERRLAALRRHALRSRAAIVRLAGDPEEPTVPGYGEAAIRARTASALMRALVAVRHSTRLRRALAARAAAAVACWYGPAILRPLVADVRAFLDGRQRARLRDHGLLPEAPSVESHRALITRATFDEEFYLAMYGDVLAAVRAGDLPDGFAHYDSWGRLEQRRARVRIPAGLFDEHFYLAVHPDVREAVERGVFASGFAHFDRYGRFERRAARIVLSREVFDEALYRRLNPDVDRAVETGSVASGYDHFLECGRWDGRPFAFRPAAERARSAA